VKSLSDQFGRTIHQAREAHGWSQELLAEKADISRSSFGEIERGCTVPLDKLARALGLSFSTPMGRASSCCTHDGLSHSCNGLSRRSVFGGYSMWRWTVMREILVVFPAGLFPR